MDDLIVAGSHGFDIWSPGGGGIERQVAGDFDELIRRGDRAAARAASARSRARWSRPKRSSVAVHYRLVDERDRAARDPGGRRADAGRAPRRAEGHAGQAGVRAPAEDRLGQGQGGAVPARALGLDARRRASRCTSATTSPTRTRSRRSPTAGSGSSSAEPDDPEVRGPGTTAPTSSCAPRRGRSSCSGAGTLARADRRAGRSPTTASSRPRRGCARR